MQHRLWDSPDDDAMIYDREREVFADPSKVREIFPGEFFRSRGRDFVAPSHTGFDFSTLDLDDNVVDADMQGVRGGPECVHLSCEFSVGPQRRQVDESFDVPDGLDIEVRNAVGELVDEAVEFCIGQGAVGVAPVPGGQRTDR
jgi:hypothetical protein